jgi:hypothetical protein
MKKLRIFCNLHLLWLSLPLLDLHWPSLDVRPVIWGASARGSAHMTEEGGRHGLKEGCPLAALTLLPSYCRRLSGSPSQLQLHLPRTQHWWRTCHPPRHHFTLTLDNWPHEAETRQNLQWGYSLQQWSSGIAKRKPIPQLDSSLLLSPQPCLPARQPFQLLYLSSSNHSDQSDSQYSGNHSVFTVITSAAGASSAKVIHSCCILYPSNNSTIEGFHFCVEALPILQRYSNRKFHCQMLRLSEHESYYGEEFWIVLLLYTYQQGGGGRYVVPSPL